VCHWYQLQGLSALSAAAQPLLSAAAQPFQPGASLLPSFPSRAQELVQAAFDDPPAGKVGGGHIMKEGAGEEAKVSRWVGAGAVGWGRALGQRQQECWPCLQQCALHPYAAPAPLVAPPHTVSPFVPCLNLPRPAPRTCPNLPRGLPRPCWPCGCSIPEPEIDVSGGEVEVTFEIPQELDVPGGCQVGGAMCPVLVGVGSCGGGVMWRWSQVEMVQVESMDLLLTQDLIT